MENLPTLTGSDKQIAWAIKIKDQKMQELDFLKKEVDKKCNAGSAIKAHEVIKIIENITSASAWITMRDEPMESIEWIIDLFRQYNETGEMAIDDGRQHIYVIANKANLTF